MPAVREKQCGSQGQTKKSMLLMKISEEKKHFLELNEYFKSLFTKSFSKNSEYASSLKTLDLPKLTHNNMMLRESKLTEREC